MDNSSLSILVMTRDRCEALKEVLLSVSLVRANNCSLNVYVYDSSNDDNYEANGQTISFFSEFKHHRLNHGNSMAQNWEFAIQKSNDDYVIMVTDRSLLKANIVERALSSIECDKSLMAVCWAWDVVTSGKLFNYRPSNNGGIELTTNDLILSLTRYGLGKYAYYLPRGLNCLLKRESINAITEKFGCVYEGINPDFSLAFKLIAGQFKVHFLNESLFVSKFTELSNGGKSSINLNFDYIRTIDNYRAILSHTKIDLPLCSNTITSDYLHILNESTIDIGLKESLKSRIVFAGYTSILLELKRFYSFGIIDSTTYGTARAKLRCFKKMNRSVSINAIQYMYCKLAEMLPVSAFNLKRRVNRFLQKRNEVIPN